MSDTKTITCPACGQKLRVPTDVGGVTMACPDCGRRFHSNFKMKAGQGSGVASSGAASGAPNLMAKAMQATWMLWKS